MEGANSRQPWNAKVPFLVAALVGVGFLFRAYPHIWLIPKFIIEESYNYQTVRDLIATGASPQAGFYPMLEHQLIYWAWLLTHIDPVALSVYANPILGALTVVPLFYVLRHRLTQNQALLGCGLWALSEAAFYRAAYFGSTEALGFLLSLGALAAYQRKRYILTAPLLLLGAASHLLPTAFTFGVVVADLVLKATTRQRILLFSLVTGAVAVFYSPLNPHQRLMSSLRPEYLLGNFGSFGIYGFWEVLGAVSIFGGFVVLGLAAAWGWLWTPKNRLMTVYLGLAAGLFIFSWIDYQPNVFAPPRLTFYFLVPLIYYAATWVNVKSVGVICVLAIASSWIGCPVMLMTEHTVTLDEYAALDELAEMKLIKDYGWWLADYPIKTTIALYAEDMSLWEVPFNGTSVITSSKRLNETFTSSTFVYPYHYVFLSERMKQGAYLIINTEGRTIKRVQPITDVWAGDPLWKLVYEGHGVKVYHYEGTI